MRYESTRGSCPQVSSAQAIKTGLAPDGGLYVPERIPKLSREQRDGLTSLAYPARAAELLSLFLTDYSKEELRQCADSAYSADKFPPAAVAPLRRLDDNISCLELWHGPTSAFKDIALQFLPYLLTGAVAKTGEAGEVVILVATSGDTGKAALEGFRDVPGTRCLVFYPHGGVSEIQRLQMATQEGANVGVVAVRGNFDDTQNGVKAIFTDAAYGGELARCGLRLSSANSINWGRLVPQIVYYFAAYAELAGGGVLTEGEAVNIVVPTGNFGNILAAYYAREMGLPVHRLICAANANNVLADFINTGVYDRNRPFVKTASPSMDILISSNLERLLYELAGRDAAVVRGWMAGLQKKGTYRIGGGALEQMQSVFWAGSANDAETFAAIKATNSSYGYTIDTHTGVAKCVYDKYRQATGDGRKSIIAATASPFKFAASVVEAIAGPAAVAGKDEFALLRELAQISQMAPPAALADLNEKSIRHTIVCERTEMKTAISHLLGL